MNKTMMSLIVFLFIIMMNSVAFAQNAPVDFEAGGYGADWTWTVFENETNPAIEILANPDNSGINTSATVAKFTALQAGQPWAGCESLHGSDIGEFSFDATNATVKVMVWKPVISDVGVKFVEASGEAQPEVKVANTLINQWEELTFDLSGSIGAGITGIIDQIIIFPDFDLAGRTSDNICYFDNITFSEQIAGAEPQVAAPAPTAEPGDVISIFSDSYVDLVGTDFNPPWGQSTIVSTPEIAGNTTLKYANFNYQGTQFSAAQDLSLMEFVHIDLWTADATVVLFTPVSAPPGELLLPLAPLEQETWNSIDIPLADFTGVPMASIFQFKFDGQQGVTPSNIYLDNIYFYKLPQGPETDATLIDLQIDGETVAGFDPLTLNYDIELPAGTVIVPVVTAETNNPEATYVINEAAMLPGITEVVVTSANEINVITYNVNFFFPTLDPEVAAPEPTQSANGVISIFSDSYDDLAGTDFNPPWGQSTVVTFEEIAGNMMLKYDNFNYQGTVLAGAQDFSGMDYLHIDMWTPDATVVMFTPISASTGENLLPLEPIVTGTWNSYDILLENFTGLSMADIVQFKFDGQQGVNPSTIYIDNVYFYAGGVTPYATIDFEAGGNGADWTWTVFENETNPPVEILANPDMSGVNTSATVAKFTALQAGQPWAGCESLHGSDFGDFTFDETNSTVKVMVWKPVISDVGVKFAEASGEAQPEVKVANTLINQWEELTFDFSGSIGAGATGIIDQIIIFPDFDLGGRTSDNICYFDNVSFHEQAGVPEGPTVAAPTPMYPAAEVISLFSNPYVDVTIDTWSADWDVANVADVQVMGDDVKLYTGLVYAGIEFTSQTIDATDMNYFHMDIWTPDPTTAPAVFKVKLVDFGADGVWGGDDVEHEITFDENSLATEEWVSLDIPMTDFTALTTIGHLAQLIISGDPNTVYIDNVYFHISGVPPIGPEVAAPEPMELEEDVISIFSDSYADLEGTNFNPGWGQTTEFSTEEIDGNFMMKLENFNYQGIQLDGNQNLLTMEFMHLDMWTADATVVMVTPISATTGEYSVSMTPIVAGSWNSYDIPVADFMGVSMGDIHQLKFDGQQGVTPSTIYLDNVYFYTTNAAGSGATLSDLQVDGITIDGFMPETLDYWVELPNGATEVPVVTATVTDPLASYVINDAEMLPGTTEVIVTAEDGTTMNTYSVNFTLAAPVPEIAAPTPEVPAEDVISLFSNPYMDVVVDTWSADWDAADVADIQIAGDDTKLYTNLVFAGIEFTSQTIDATGMNHFHMDIWTPDATAAPAVFRVKLVDFGADGVWGGDDVEHELTFDETTLASEAWVSLDIPLEDFTGLTTTGHLAQLIISGDLSTLYMDNVYFYDDGIVPWIYGDITGDDNVDAFDAANILQYSVMLDPIGAPLPWTWQLIAGDVDGNDSVEAYDAALVLQYSVDIIDIFPVEVGRNDVPQAELGVNLINGEIVFTASGEFYSAQIGVDPSSLELGTAVVTNGVMNAVNPQEYSIALASAEIMAGEIIRLPYRTLADQNSVSLSITVNGISSEYTINPQDLESGQVPVQNALLGNYPNPFNPVTNIRLSVADPGTQVSVKIFNIKGQIVKDLFSGELDSGYHSLTWNGNDNAGNPAASGLYFYQAQIGAHSKMSKMLMLK